MSIQYAVTVATRRYEQRARAASAEATRRRILDALYDRLHDAPAAPVSVDAVAQAAGVARSTVYVVFGSRAGLFDAFAADRAVAWIDDALNEQCVDWAAARNAAGVSTLLVETEPHVGFTDAHLAELVAFAEAIAGEPQLPA